MVYVAYMDKNTILKIDGQTNEIISTIDMENTLFDIVSDPVTHKLYASTKFADKVLVIGPESIATALPVITVATPPAVLGTIRVHGQDTTTSNAILDINGKKLTIDVDTLDGGDLAIQIPRAMLDAKSGDGVDSQFQLLIDGTQVEYDEALSSDYTREITVFVPQGSQKLEVIGTTAIPEFGLLP